MDAVFVKIYTFDAIISARVLCGTPTRSRLPWLFTTLQLPCILQDVLALILRLFRDPSSKGYYGTAMQRRDIFEPALQQTGVRQTKPEASGLRISKF